jgi:hypothetical protein
LPYRDGSMDVVVLDPPYVHSPRVKNGHDYAACTTRYNNNRTTAGLLNRDIRSFIATECVRRSVCSNPMAARFG